MITDILNLYVKNEGIRAKQDCDLEAVMTDKAYALVKRDSRTKVYEHIIETAYDIECFRVFIQGYLAYSAKAI